MLKSATKLQHIIESYGYKTMAAGGFVRDFLLKRSYKDIDLATQAKPEKLIEIFEKEDIKYVPTGLQHGTITAIVDGHNIEVTTLRVDTECDGRHAQVSYTDDFALDAKRRDFTINAMFMDLKTLKIYDYVNGKQDLDNKIIRFVGNPIDRINEDALRILRYYRFIAVLGFTDIDKESDKACKESLDLLDNISKERIHDEFIKMIKSEYFGNIAWTHKSVLLKIIPELKICDGFNQNNPHHIHNVYDHIIHGVVWLWSLIDGVPNDDETEVLIAYLFHDIGKPAAYSVDENGVGHFYDHEHVSRDIAEKVMIKLRFTLKQMDRICFYVKNHMRLHYITTRKAVRKLYKDCIEAGDPNMIYGLYIMKKADDYASGKTVGDTAGKDELYQLIVDSTKDKPEEMTCPLNGEEIMELLHVAPGKIIKEAKSFIEELIINEEIKPNDKAEAIDRLVQRFGIF
jgi:tRNA nucleotidyltransferase (CCA-adding enzyme)